MEKFDETEFKRVVSALRAPHAPWRIGFAQRPPVSKNRRAAGKVLEAALAKAGLDVSKLDEMLAQDRREVRSDFRKQLAKTDFSAAEDAYRQGIEAQTKAMGLLTQPFTTTFITLDTAFLIWQLPHPELNIFIDSNTGSLNNFIKILINEITGNDAPSFVFYFLWQNTNNSPVVINAASQLAPGGFCEIAAAPGLFSGDSSYLGIYALFRTMRWSGWGTDPMTGQSADQTYFPGSQQSQLRSIVDLTASGGSYFGSGQDVEMKSLFFQNVDVSQDQILVPGRAVAVFEVSFNLSYGFGTGGNVEDLVNVNFNTGSNAVFCPFVLLEQFSPIGP